MSNWALQGDSHKFEVAGATAADSSGTQIASAATDNTKGSYAELIASTAFDASGFSVLMANSSDRFDCLVDIAVGASGSEQDIVSNYLLKMPNSSGSGHISGFFPIRIPAGTRVSARWQTNGGAIAHTVDVEVVLASSSFIPSKPLGKVTTYGADTTDSGGKTIDPGGTANTKGSYVEITSATTNPIKYLIIGFSANDNNSLSDFQFLYDIAIGESGAEQVLIPDMLVATNSGEYIWHLKGLPCHIPTGTRIAVRSQCSGTHASDRLLDIALYGIS